MIWSSSHETSRHTVEWITLSCYFATSLFRHLTIHGSRTIPSLELDNLFTVHFLSPNLYLRPFLPAILFCLSLLFQWSPAKTPISSKNHSMASFHQNRKYNRFICRPFSRQNSFKSLYKNFFFEISAPWLHSIIPKHLFDGSKGSVPSFRHSAPSFRHSLTSLLFTFWQSKNCLRSNNPFQQSIPTIHSNNPFQQSIPTIHVNKQRFNNQQSVKASFPVCQWK